MEDYHAEWVTPINVDYRLDRRIETKIVADERPILLKLSKVIAIPRE
jgi:hypothetical protein